MAYQPNSNKISTGNSSTSTLTNGSTFTGTWEDVSNYDSIVVSVKTDQDGIYYIEFSPDGTNTDSSLTRYYNTGDIEAPHRFTITRQYARVRFTNDSGSDQTEFRLQTTLKKSAENLNIPIDGTMSRDYDAIATRPTDYHLEVAEGKRQGHNLFNKFGYNDDVDIGTEVLAAFGGTFTYLTSASTLDAVSTDNADSDTGGTNPQSTGARTLLISGLDTNRQNQTEILTMDGTNSVTTSSSWLGVNRVSVLTSGSSEGNVGDISITATTGGSNQAFLPAGESITQQLIYFTPAETQAMIESIWLNIVKPSGQNPVVTVKGWSYNAGTTQTKYEIFRATIDTGVENTLSNPIKEPLPLSPTDVFWIEVTTDKADTVVNGRVSIIEIKNPSAD